MDNLSQKELKKSIIEANPKLDKIDILTRTFKAFVAKMFEHTLTRKAKEGDDRLEFDAMAVVKKNLISEFRKAELGEYQRSVKWYEDLFDTSGNSLSEILAKTGLKCHMAFKDRLNKIIMNSSETKSFKPWPQWDKELCVSVSNICGESMEKYGYGGEEMWQKMIGAGGY